MGGGREVRGGGQGGVGEGQGGVGGRQGRLVLGQTTYVPRAQSQGASF